MIHPSGQLSIVATPIGNLEDITFRALRTLRESNRIAAEDTRRTATLLNHYEIHKPLLSYHDFNEARRTPELLQHLHNGERIALVTDAGMPSLSDPGLRLVRAAIDAGIRLEVIPGPSALTMALAASALPVEPFLFYGFFPHKSAQRRRILTELAPLPYTLAFFESPHRLLRALADMEELLGDRHAVIARELTKKFEQILRDRLSLLRKSLENRAIKGEITLLVEGNTK